MRSVVEQNQPRARRIAKIDNVQCRRLLIEIVPVTARIESEERAEQQANGRFVRHNENILAGVFPNELD